VSNLAHFETLKDLAYSLARFKRAMNTPQSIVLTVPGRASSRATEIL